MGYHSPRLVKKVRNCFLVLLVLHLVLLSERLVFDGLGHIYATVLFTTLSFIFITLGIVGSIRYDTRLLIALAIWLVLSIAFNVFVVFLYLNLGGITHKDYWLSFSEDKSSWFRENGFGCTVNGTVTKYGDKKITGCYLNYEDMEIIQASVHIFISSANLMTCVWLVYKFRIEEEEEHFGFVGGFDPYTARAAPICSSQPKLRYLEEDYEM